MSPTQFAPPPSGPQDPAPGSLPHRSPSARCWLQVLWYRYASNGEYVTPLLGLNEILKWRFNIPSVVSLFPRSAILFQIGKNVEYKNVIISCMMGLAYVEQPIALA